MIVECINDDFTQGGKHPAPPGNIPKKGNLYEVCRVENVRYNEFSPFYELREIKTGVLFTHKSFREIDIDIIEVQEIIEDKVPLFV